MNIRVAVHGGAGTMPKKNLTDEFQKSCHEALRAALTSSYQILSSGGTALDAVEAAVAVLEDFEWFNAGRGSVFTNKGTHEMDASIMDGSTLKSGAIAGVSNVRNPVKLARKVLEHSEHVLLLSDGAEEFARLHNIRFEEDAYFFTQFRYDQLERARQNQVVVLDHIDEKKFGTVGAVALDQSGNLAAATSTGGMTNKLYGRVGDSALVGCGTYANNHTCAVSCTGHGEYFIENVVAYDISCLLEYKNMSLERAAEFVVNEKLRKVGAEGGIIAIDKMGNIALPFNTEGMYRGWMKGLQEIETAIY